MLTVSSYATRTSPVLRGKWILENLLERAAAGSAARRAQPERGDGGRDRVAAPAAGSAPHEPDVRRLPPPHGSARLRPGELRRASAPGARPTRQSRSTPPATAGRAHVRRPGRAARHPRARARRVRTALDGQAAHLRARPRPDPRTGRSSAPLRVPCPRTTTGSRRSCSRSCGARRSSCDGGPQS